MQSEKEDNPEESSRPGEEPVDRFRRLLSEGEAWDEIISAENAEPAPAEDEPLEKEPPAEEGRPLDPDDFHDAQTVPLEVAEDTSPIPIASGVAPVEEPTDEEVFVDEFLKCGFGYG